MAGPVGLSSRSFHWSVYRNITSEERERLTCGVQLGREPARQRHSHARRVGKRPDCKSLNGESLGTSALWIWATGKLLTVGRHVVDKVPCCHVAKHAMHRWECVALTSLPRVFDSSATRGDGSVVDPSPGAVKCKGWVDLQSVPSRAYFSE
ncbi:hypothetical protein BKA80DRAFT_123059 [Phyllosticta citrichinensis]